MKEKSRHFLLLTTSTLIMAAGTYFFKFTNNFTFGGITGLAVLVAKTGVMSASDFTFIMNMLLLAIGFFVLGKNFAAKTAYCSILLSVSLSVLERVCPMDKPLTNQPMLELCFAIALPALGSAILFNIGSSSGGTDIIAMILRKYSSFDIGRALLFTDLLITVAGCFMFDIETGLYSFLGLAIRSFMIDTFIESFNLSKYCHVVCDHPQPVCDFIVHTLHRSATVCHAQGAFSGKDKYIVLTALNRPQAVRLRNYIKETQPEAFILISNTSEIIGKGFHSI
ncbi:MAG: YitT family protein [Clostridiales bacterium]|nr:YitT family protein [Clostridiales bacterium]